MDKNKIFEGQILKHRRPRYGYWEKVKVVALCEQSDNSVVAMVKSIKGCRRYIVDIKDLEELS